MNSAAKWDRLMHIWIAIAAALLLTASTWAGPVVYVSPAGSDLRGDGSREKPCCSLGYAISTVADRDHPTVILLPGLYQDSQSLSRHFQNPCTIKSETPYQARLCSPKTSNRVLSIYSGSNITLEGLELFGSGATRGEYLVHIGTKEAHHIEFDNCIIHDGYNNDLIKINDQTHDIAFRNCVFFNQTDHGGDEHFDINTCTDVQITDSTFFNDYAGSGRSGKNQSHSFIVIKNSGSTPDVTRNVALRRNVFLNYQGLPDEGFILLGEDGQPFYEAQNIAIENNLFIHNSPVRLWGAMLFKGGLRDITVRANTIVGHPNVVNTGAFAAACFRIGKNPPIGNVTLANNLFSDPTGRMARLTMSNRQHFSPDARQVMLNNLYWNRGKPIPTDVVDILTPANDAKAILADPRLPAFSPNPILPRFDPAKSEFKSGQKDIRSEFERLVKAYAIPAAGSAVIDAADSSTMPADDILGHARGDHPDIGCFEVSGK
jgi:hypothetical protein